ncbi:hypothetical protein SAMN05444166_0670 [Singulisphaera sp. GP187]|uniref:hypothetical protein n=1 Tax=Singulisphaera sp. GP187 TaxID=1882752 RepID=UPI00092B6433|nr:hypothetical protein [Singulisphaera sp. GP187]SIN75740.1 hypothetical protein SAMN05444166_0670 [Singulisphaera sp. GP187]
MKSLVLITASFAILGLSHARGEDKPSDGARERVELAKRIYKGRIVKGLELRFAPPQVELNNTSEDPLLNEVMAEELHKWSVRWMEAECDAAVDQAGRVVAAQTHLDRMMAVESGKMARKELADHPLLKEIDKFRKGFVDAGVEALREINPAAASRYRDVARYFRLEAEARLAREKAGR